MGDRSLWSQTSLNLEVHVITSTLEGQSPWIPEATIDDGVLEHMGSVRP
jgi:hypothetical protein